MVYTGSRLNCIMYKTLEKTITIPKGTVLTRYGGNIRGLGYLTADKKIFIDDSAFKEGGLNDNADLDSAFMAELKEIIYGGQPAYSFWAETVNKKKIEAVKELIENHEKQATKSMFHKLVGFFRKDK